MSQNSGRVAWNKGIKTGMVPANAFQKGHTPALKGKKNPKMTGALHPRWKGEAAGYAATHSWLKRTFGKPNKCDNLGCVYPRKNKSYKKIYKPKRFEWANISGLYKRDRFDYIRLCPSCHRQLDNKTLQLQAFVIDGATYVLKR